jgi:hypothetical protein
MVFRMAAWQIFFWVDLYLPLYFLYTSFLRFYYINSFGHSLYISYLQSPVLRRTYLAETPHGNPAGIWWEVIWELWGITLVSGRK